MKPAEIELEKLQRIWDKRPDETIEQFKAFTVYRNHDPADRKATRVADSVGVHYKTINFWKRQFEWEARAFRYDNHVKGNQHEVHRQRALNLNESQAGIATAMLGKVNERLKNLDARELEPKDCVAWFKAAAEISRKALGADKALRSSVRRSDDDDDDWFE